MSQSLDAGRATITFPFDFNLNRSIYTYCELEPVKEGQIPNNPVYDVKSWTPPTFILQEISARLKAQVRITIFLNRLNKE